MAITWIKRGLIAAAVAVVGYQWVSCYLAPHGDFVLHWDDGMRMRLGIAAPGRHVPYPPAWGAFHVPLSLLSMNAAKAVAFLGGFSALVGLLWMLNDLTKSVMPLARGKLFWVVTGTLLAGSRFILRDFDDGGQNLFLFTLAWLGFWLFVKQRPFSGGASLGLAIALKLTAAIFVLYFLAKRQWNMVTATLMWSALFFFVMPLPWLEPFQMIQHVTVWKNNLVRGAQEPDPSRGVLGEEPIANKSLRPALARYLMHLPPGHLGRHPHPGYVDIGDLSPKNAGLVIKGILLAGLLGLAWLLRKPLASGDPMTLISEAAIISVAMLLYSPITWGQHCVAALPALYFLIRGVASGVLRPRGTAIWLACVLLPIFLSNRGVVGKELSLLLESYHVTTFALVVLLIAVANHGRLGVRTVLVRTPGTDAADTVPRELPSDRAAA
jgi:alpha-1,2-mannosyltransferase